MATKLDTKAPVHLNLALPQDKHTILNPVLSVFSKLGQQKLCETHFLKDVLSNRQIIESTHSALASLSPLITPPVPDKPAPNLNTLSCSLCDVKFSSREEMLEHYKDDWHRYNLRLQLAGKKQVEEQEFNLLLSQDISSISGSDSSDDDQDTITKSPPKLMLYCNIDNTVCSVYRELVHHPAHTPDTLNQLLRSISLVPERTRVAVLMQSAGHFAGAIFHGETILCHKTFHRYVVRAKGGTIQSTQDKSSFARSMGAQIRRANEAALIKDIQELLRSWSDKLSKCDVIFIRIPVYSRQTFYAEGENFGFFKDDSRVRPVPVNTRRPTFTEVKRIHALMTSMFVHGTLDDFTAEDDDVTMVDHTGTSPPNRHIVKDLFDALDVEVVERNMEKETKCEKKPKKSRRAKKSKKSNIEILDPFEQFFEQLMEACGKCETPKVLSLLAQIGDPLSFPEPVESPEVIDTVSMEKSAVESGSDEDWVVLEDPINSVIEDTDVIEDNIPEPQEDNPSMIQSEYTPNTLEDSIESITIRIWDDFLDTEKRRVLQMTNSEGYTPLHLAAHKGFSPLIFHFLRYGADPTVKDKQGKVPYERARDKPSRDAFRRFMFSHPLAYNYSDAKISSPLSPEMEEEQRRRKVEKKKSKGSAKKQRKNTGKQEEGEVCKVLSEREKRALAAEKRFMSSAVTSGDKCAQCMHGLQGDSYFEKSSYLYCSMYCLKKHRQQVVL
ncbi:Ankyrin repeat and zinc finger domain-containing protein 1 [Oopsacas minuta]|uniref:Ankyrin repeat and zinc finger domain-containing protein 1 n=1 Tax=Oopsacas minuta TaxID=111878 RepID=A0AAV7JCM0_9METZ|nr:Ankyrin repeat and zinc finger domain-containing protein 1 [Oopsacas minuta]